MNWRFGHSRRTTSHETSEVDQRVDQFVARAGYYPETRPRAYEHLARGRRCRGQLRRPKPLTKSTRPTMNATIARIVRASMTKKVVDVVP